MAPCIKSCVEYLPLFIISCLPRSAAQAAHAELHHSLSQLHLALDSVQWIAFNVNSPTHTRMSSPADHLRFRRARSSTLPPSIKVTANAYPGPFPSEPGLLIFIDECQKYLRRRARPNLSEEQLGRLDELKTLCADNLWEAEKEAAALEGAKQAGGSVRSETVLMDVEKLNGCIHEGLPFHERADRIVIELEKRLWRDLREEFDPVAEPKRHQRYVNETNGLLGCPGLMH